MSLVEIIGLSLIEIVGDFSLKQYANGGGFVHLAMGITGYIGVVIMLIISLQGSTVLLVNAAWDGMSALTGSIMRLFYFRRTVRYLFTIYGGCIHHTWIVFT